MMSKPREFWIKTTFDGFSHTTVASLFPCTGWTHVREVLTDPASNEEIEQLKFEAKSWENVAREWMDSYDKLKAKYEPMHAALSSELKAQKPVKSKREDMPLDFEKIFQENFTDLLATDKPVDESLESVARKYLSDQLDEPVHSQHVFAPLDLKEAFKAGHARGEAKSLAKGWREAAQYIASYSGQYEKMLREEAKRLGIKL